MSDMSDDQIVRLLEEIRDLQNQQLQLAHDNNRRYAEAVKSNEKAVSRARKSQIVLFVLMLLVFGSLIYAEWFAAGIPKPSWMK